MHRVTDTATFLGAPVGSQLLAKNFEYWYPHRALTGFSLSGNPDVADITSLNTVMDVVLRPTGGPHRSLVDMKYLGTVDPAAFRTMAEYVASRWEGFGRTVQRQAVLRPNGFSGAVVAGFFEVVSPKYPVKVFDDLAPAITWLGIDTEIGFIAAVQEARSHAESANPLLRQLRNLLPEQTGFAKLSEIARRLGVSERTLQRRLRAASTTFNAEVHSAKLAEAQKLMLSGGLNLTRIALDLGFASLQHFSAMFRKAHSESPSAWLRKRAANESPRMLTRSSAA
jgi:AraC-like DNA-binding protein